MLSFTCSSSFLDDVQSTIVEEYVCSGTIGLSLFLTSSGPTFLSSDSENPYYGIKTQVHPILIIIYVKVFDITVPNFIENSTIAKSEHLLTVGGLR